MDKIAEWAAELQSLAQAGLYYAKDVFDQRRDIEKQQLLYGVTQFCYYGLEELMAGPT